MRDYFQRLTPAAPLSLFRIGFGTLLLAGTVRFWLNGWIEELYIQPTFYFPYYGLEFVKPWGEYTYLLFIICGTSALFVALGLYYRIAAVSLFLSFTYIELIDKTTYLNHYYFISMISLMLIFLPAHRYFSLDAYRNPSQNNHLIPTWMLDSIRFFVAFLYVFAGIAKLNSDWLLEALPLRIWLPAQNDFPLIGWLFNYPWVAYAFSWFGCVYDLSIPFLLWNHSTRKWAFAAVVVFHSLTALLFPIGMFPYVMIVTALIYFPSTFHYGIIRKFQKAVGLAEHFVVPRSTYLPSRLTHSLLVALFSVFFLIQILVPFRYLLYPDEVFWTEQGYRFSWRVMLMEKAGYAQFTVMDATGKKVIVNNDTFLTPFQEKMMSTQPDMMVQYARYLHSYYAQRGFSSPQVFVDSYVALNGRMGRPLVDPKVDLAQQSDNFLHKTWILPFNDDIKGF